MEMRYFWLLDGKAQKQFSFKHQPGEEILVDYPSKRSSSITPPSDATTIPSNEKFSEIPSTRETS
jgi:hypothetical protein